MSLFINLLQFAGFVQAQSAHTYQASYNNYFNYNQSTKTNIQNDKLNIIIKKKQDILRDFLRIARLKFFEFKIETFYVDINIFEFA